MPAAPRLKGLGVKARLMRRPSQYHALTRQQRCNDLIARAAGPRWRPPSPPGSAAWASSGPAAPGLEKVAGRDLMTAMAFNLRRLAVLTA
jgi:hypothetical protein